MATTTRVLGLELLSEGMDDWWTDTTTGAGAGGGTTVVDTSLAQLSDDDDFCIGWYVRITSGSADLEIRLVTAYTASTTTITTLAFSAQIGSGVTYELHRINPQTKLNALARASVVSFPHLYVPIRHSFNADSYLDNPSFEDLDSGSEVFASWTAWNSPTVTQETNIFHEGRASAKIVAAGSVEGLRQLVYNRWTNVIGATATFQLWVLTATAPWARLRIISETGTTETTINTGDYHTGDGEWTLLSASGEISGDVDQLICEIECADGATAYFDGGGDAGLYISGRRRARHTIPTTIIKGPYRITQQYAKDQVHGPFYDIIPDGSPIAGHVLLMEGMGTLSVPTTDAGTIEIGEPFLELFLAYAMRWLYRTIMQAGNAQERQYLSGLQQTWDQDIADMTQRPVKRRGFAMQPMLAQKRNGVWDDEEDANGRFIVFKGMTEPNTVLG